MGWLPLTFTYAVIVAIKWTQLTKCCLKSRKVVSLIGVLVVTNCTLTVILPHLHFMSTSFASLSGLIFGLLLKKFDKSQAPISDKTPTSSYVLSPTTNVNNRNDNNVTTKITNNNNNTNNINNGIINGNFSIPNGVRSSTQIRSKNKHFYISLGLLSLASISLSAVIMLLQMFHSRLIDKTIEKGLYNLDCIWTFNLAHWCHV